MDITNKTISVTTIIQDYGFPIVAVFFLAYFIWYLWQYITKEITPTVKYLHHDKRDLYNENGFVLDFYARGKPWDIHPNSEFYVDGGIVKILENELQ